LPPSKYLLKKKGRSTKYLNSYFYISKTRIAYEQIELRRKQGYGTEVAANLCGTFLTAAADVSRNEISVIHSVSYIILYHL